MIFNLKCELVQLVQTVVLKSLERCMVYIIVPCGWYYGILFLWPRGGVEGGGQANTP